MSVQQLEALIEFLEGQPELALGRCSRSKEGRSLAKRLWVECAGTLNSISADCVQKTADQWRLFYNEFKHRLLKKIKKEKNEKVATGGGPPVLIQLTPLQERLYSILGHDVGEPIPGVRHNPLAHIENKGGSGGTCFNSMGVNVVDDEDDPGNFQMEFINFELALDPEAPGSQCPIEPTSQRQSAERTFQAAGTSQTAGASQAAGTSQAAGSSQDARISQAAGNYTSNTRRPAPRRRRRRREELAESDDPSLRRATDRLEAIEEVNAQATREHAQATNRLAKAIKTLADRLKEPFKIVFENPPQTVQRRRKRVRIYDSSDSEEN